MKSVGMPHENYQDRVDCMFDCGLRCKCAEEFAVKWLKRAVVFCGLIWAFVWLAPVVMRVMAQ